MKQSFDRLIMIDLDDNFAAKLDSTVPTNAGDISLRFRSNRLIKRARPVLVHRIDVVRCFRIVSHS